MNAAHGVSDKLSRIGGLSFDGTTVATYTYYGLGTAVKVLYDDVTVAWDLITGSGANPYAGLDRFGRVIDNLWRETINSVDLDRIKYDYDRASNRIWRENPVAKAQTTPQYYDELYAYDGAYRLVTMQRGQLAGSPPSSITNKRFAQAWPLLDPSGNWSEFTEDTNGNGTNDLDQDRTANTVNEITAITNTIGAAWKQPGYDAAGNMTSLPQPLVPTAGYLATYDAWHRLVKLRTDVAAPVTVAEYAYDGITRRTVKKPYANGALSETRHYYYCAAWQVLEERIDAATTYARQYVWGLRYIDDCVLRDLDSSGDKTRVYILQDANWNVTAITQGGLVGERYAYSPYGQPSFLYPDFTSKATPGEFEWDILYAGYKWDAESGLFQVRFRYLHPTLGGWVTRDRALYFDGTNSYKYAQCCPISLTDSLGLAAVSDTEKQLLQKHCKCGLANLSEKYKDV
ncbi:MAG: RHS repeat-associated core domain-containing protein [Pirellulales bacterium]|nr:RHS repeat-associated core domain-containing protein [Pirellulales bacterium]